MPSWNDIIKQYFGELMEFVKSAKNFATEQIPLYLQELIKYEIFSSLLWGTFLVCMLGVFAYGAYWFHQKGKNDRRADPEGCAFAKWALILIIFVISWTPFYHYNKALKAYVAPRVVIVEKIQDMISDTTGATCSKGK